VLTIIVVSPLFELLQEQEHEQQQHGAAAAIKALDCLFVRRFTFMFNRI
jgi:hypothetical protein